MKHFCTFLNTLYLKQAHKDAQSISEGHGSRACERDNLCACDATCRTALQAHDSQLPVLTSWKHLARCWDPRMHGSANAEAVEEEHSIIVLLSQGMLVAEDLRWPGQREQGLLENE